MKAMRINELITMLSVKNQNMLITKEYVDDLFDTYGDDYYREMEWGSEWELTSENENKKVLINHLTRRTY